MEHQGTFIINLHIKINLHKGRKSPLHFANVYWLPCSNTTAHGTAMRCTAIALHNAVHNRTLWFVPTFAGRHFYKTMIQKTIKHCTSKQDKSLTTQLECKCPNFDLFPSGKRDAGLSTSLSGVQTVWVHSFDRTAFLHFDIKLRLILTIKVTYNKYEAPNKDFSRGSCPG